MDLECEHASILGKKMSPFGRAVMEIFKFFFVELLTVHPIYISESESNRTFPVRVRFGSTEFLKSRFGFGSVRLNFQKVSSGSVRFD